MVGFPYTKAMNSNWDLDQAAALILCSVAAAEAAGVARDRWVFPWSGTDAHDTMLFSERDNFWSSPGHPHRRAGRPSSWPGGSVDDVAHVDLYSCFPSAVQIAATELGLSQDRQLTLTGGLPFAGGPLNNYVMHSLATMTGGGPRAPRRPRAGLGERRVRHQARHRALLHRAARPALPPRRRAGRGRPLPDAARSTATTGVPPPSRPTR